MCLPCRPMSSPWVRYFRNSFLDHANGTIWRKRFTSRSDLAQASGVKGPAPPRGQGVRGFQSPPHKKETAARAGLVLECGRPRRQALKVTATTCRSAIPQRLQHHAPANQAALARDRRPRTGHGSCAGKYEVLDKVGGGLGDGDGVYRASNLGLRRGPRASQGRPPRVLCDDEGAAQIAFRATEAVVTPICCARGGCSIRTARAGWERPRRQPRTGRALHRDGAREKGRNLRRRVIPRGRGAIPGRLRRGNWKNRAAAGGLRPWAPLNALRPSPTRDIQSPTPSLLTVGADGQALAKVPGLRDRQECAIGICLGNVGPRLHPDRTRAWLGGHARSYVSPEAGDGQARGPDPSDGPPPTSTSLGVTPLRDESRGTALPLRVDPRRRR